MKKTIYLFMAAAAALATSCVAGQTREIPAEITLSKEVLMDKIKGGWAGQTIGVTYGGPTEFVYKGTMIQDYFPIKYEDGIVKKYYEENPGLYDDVYMDLTFVDVFEKYGLDAPVEKFAEAFTNKDYILAHANQAARYNILNGIMPPMSGHWTKNAHADDIDFQIEADYAGLMAPGMINSAIHFTDEIGHIMNYGDGWYGGVYVAAMYALAFIYDDAPTIAREALEVIPKESRFYRCIADVIRWHDAYPDNWKKTWAEVEINYSEDVACPDGVFNTFNIDAVVNSAYVAIGMLYGENDFYKTMDIATRCGQDSDCNPATVAGVWGTMKGYSQIPEKWMKNIREVEDMNFAYTDISLNKAYQMSFNQALQVISRYGGKVTDQEVTIKTQQPEVVRLEQGFTNIRPIDYLEPEHSLAETPYSFDFEGIGFAVAHSRERHETDYVGKVEIKIDGEVAEVVKLPDTVLGRKFDLFSIYDLPKGKHHVDITWLNPKPSLKDIAVNNIIIYTAK